jgi:hypothetical protein
MLNLGPHHMVLPGGIQSIKPAFAGFIFMSKQYVGQPLKVVALFFSHYYPEGVYEDCRPLQKVNLGGKHGILVCGNRPASRIKSVGCLRVLFPEGEVKCLSSVDCPD